MTKNYVCRIPYLSGSIYHMIMIFGTDVYSDDISRCFFHCFKILIFLVVREGLKSKNGSKWQKIRSVSLQYCVTDVTLFFKYYQKLKFNNSYKLIFFLLQIFIELESAQVGDYFDICYQCSIALLAKEKSIIQLAQEPKMYIIKIFWNKFFLSTSRTGTNS